MIALALGWLFGCAAPAPEAPAASAERLEALTARLTDLGPRLAGTDAEHAAAAEILSMFEAAGLESWTHDFTWDAWGPGPALVTGGGLTIEGVALSPSAPTDAPLALGLVDAGDADSVSGAAALYSSDDGSRAEQFVSALLGGADAMLRVTEDLDFDGGALVEVGHTLDGSALPAAAFDATNGALLRGLIGQEIDLEIQSSLQADHVSQDVIGLLPGAGAGAIYLVAHYDSWHLSESAMDNALGVAMAVMIAEALAGQAPERDVYFIATSGEEQGLQGAQAWVADNADAVDADGRSVLTLDIPWSNEGWFFCGATDEGWKQVALDEAAALGLEVYDGGTPSPASDHVPFQAAGLDAAWCTRQPDRHYHTDADTLDWLDMDEALLAWRVNLALTMAAAGLD